LKLHKQEIIDTKIFVWLLITTPSLKNRKKKNNQEQKLKTVILIT